MIVVFVENIEESVFWVCEVVYKEIDLVRYFGGYFRLGFVDFVFIYIILICVFLKECGEIVINFGNCIVSGIKGILVFFFGYVDCLLLRGLVERCKVVNWY